MGKEYRAEPSKTSGALYHSVTYYLCNLTMGQYVWVCVCVCERERERERETETEKERKRDRERPHGCMQKLVYQRLVQVQI